MFQGVAWGCGTRQVVRYVGTCHVVWGLSMLRLGSVAVKQGKEGDGR